MRVLCTGPESSGTRLLARIVATGTGIEAIHRSIPHGIDWDPFAPHAVGEIDRAILIVRSWTATAKSQSERGLVPNEAVGVEHLQIAIPIFFRDLGSHPWWMVTYQNLIDYPTVVLAELNAFLGAELSLPEDLYDANQKWIGVR